MLSENTQLYEDQFTEEEYRTVRKHQQTAEDSNISWMKMLDAWRDEMTGVLCVRYVDGRWWHYKKGEWW